MTKTVEQLLDEARARLRRLSPAEAADAQAAGALLVDIRSAGCTSSLAAATLQDMVFRNATDVAGGFQAWKATGLPVG